MRKGATGALQQQGGNASDQAALLVALLRYKQIPARFVTGTVEIPIDRAANWAGVSDPDVAAKTLAGLGIPTTAVISGGKITAVRIEHVWVEAYVPYENYRGQAPGKGQKTWVPMDPSFKKHNIKPGIDITSVTGLEQQNINELVASLGDLSNENQAEVEARLEEINQQINTATGSFTSYIQDNGLENGKLEDIIGGREIIPEHLKILPASLPYKLVAISGKYQSMPTDLTDYITLAVGGADPFGLNFSGENDFSYQASAPELYGKRITLSWIPATAEDENVINQYGGIFKTPAYLVELKPQLKIDGRIIATGNPVGLGYRQNFSITIKSAGLSEEKVDNPVTVGGFYCLGLDYQNIAPAELEQISNKLKQFESTVNETNVYTDEILGEMLNGIAKAYFGELDLLNKIAAQQCQVITSRQLSTAITGYGPQVGYMFSSPAQVKEGNLFIDVDRNVIGVTSINGKKENEKAYMLISGVTASSMEHLIFEQITGMPSLSAIKILNEASIRGVPIYTITSENLSELLPRLEVSQSVKTDIQNSINAGHIVIIPQKEFNYYDWEGSGYIVLDPDTGAAGYMISGGIAGGSTALITTLTIILGIISSAILLYLSIAGLIAAATLGTVILAMVAYVVAVYFFVQLMANVIMTIQGDPQAGAEALNLAIANIIALPAGFILGAIISNFIKAVINPLIRAVTEYLSSSSLAAARRLMSQGFSEELIQNLVRISGSKSLAAAEQVIADLEGIGISRSLIETIAKSQGYEGLVAAKALINAGKASEAELANLINWGCHLDDVFTLANKGIIPAEYSKFGVDNRVKVLTAIEAADAAIAKGSIKTWGEFLNATSKTTVKDASNAYIELIEKESAWPEGFVREQHMRTLQPGKTFNMVLDSMQADTSPGNYGTFDYIPNVDYARTYLAIKSIWKTDCGLVVTYRVKEGMFLPVVEGPVGPQIDLVVNKYLPGGGNQIEMLLDKSINKMDYLEVISKRNIN